MFGLRYRGGPLLRQPTMFQVRPPIASLGNNTKHVFDSYTIAAAASAAHAVCGYTMSLCAPAGGAP